MEANIAVEKVMLVSCYTAVDNMILENPPNTSGQGKDAVIPPEIRRWNWGAAVFMTIWVYANGLTFAQIRKEEGLPFIFAFFLGARGNAIAWKYVRWSSVEAFLRAQRRWEAAALVLLIVVVVWVAAFAFTTL